MNTPSHSPRIGLAIITALGIFAVSFAALLIADEASDLTAVFGGTGVVLSGALIGLVLLAARWQGAAGSGYVLTDMEQSVSERSDSDVVMGDSDERDVAAG